MTDENPEKGPLLELRAALDELDHELLDLLVRRMEIVAEVAAQKRTHRVRIRDLERERRILEDRCARADDLGLSPDSIESVWRQLMLMSRERQAALRAEVPLDVETQTIAIIGGEGGMGGSLKKLFSDLGHQVLSADVDTELRPQDAAATADVVVISVPIRETRAVIEQLGPLVREEALLMDVTSIKIDPMEAMLAS
ncbi:MAG: prephenate dehydrogenase/arogenate dehydrogenase family protein, partial [Deltaproteobacteria bacterium]|nr:prephenate dehydrogenase/arogenate dehydrogenase family protein [Deltaproteobacteria bacterium]